MTTTPRCFSLAGRTALVTGSTTGLGRATARCLGLAGAKVAVNYANSQARADETLAALQADGITAELFRADVTSEAEIDRMVTAIEQTLGSVDIIVCNATPPQPLKSIEEYDWAFHQQMLDFFVKSPFLLARALLPHMKQQRWGRIVNIGSEVFRRGVGNFSPYVAAKGAQTGWTRSMATELAPWQITVNQVSPGWIPVERHANDAQSDKDAYNALIPLKRWGVPDDVGGMVAFLCSDAASFITGQDVAVNGGMTVT